MYQQTNVITTSGSAGTNIQSTNNEQIMSTISTLDSFINVSSGQTTNQQEILSRLSGFKKAPQYQTFLSLMSSQSHSKAIDDAVFLLGLPPFGNDSSSFNEPWLNFYALVKYIKTYPLPDSLTKCTVAKTVLLALNDELDSVDKNRVLGGTDDNFNRAYIIAINTIKQEYEGFYANSDCELKISQQSSQYESDQSAKSTADSAALVSQETNTATSNTSTYVMYGLGGVAVLVVILVAVKLIKK